jgi:hypothetical protein
MGDDNVVVALAIIRTIALGATLLEQYQRGEITEEEMKEIWLESAASYRLTSDRWRAGVPTGQVGDPV